MQAGSQKLIAAAAFCAIVGSSLPGHAMGTAAWNEEEYRGGEGGYADKAERGSHDEAPGPIIEVGLSLLVLAGGYALVRRYRRRETDGTDTRKQASHG